MSLRFQASRLVVVAVVACLLCAICALGSMQASDAPGNHDTGIAVVYADLEDPADSAGLGEHADPEDADSMSATRDADTIAISMSVPRISTERARSIRPDRPPRLVHLG
jgi:hypothetical protein